LNELGQSLLGRVFTLVTGLLLVRDGTDLGDLVPLLGPLSVSRKGKGMCNFSTTVGISVNVLPERADVLELNSRTDSHIVYSTRIHKVLRKTWAIATPTFLRFHIS
jgi:hypothetical protein